jgi:protein-disulfide isomerase
MTVLRIGRYIAILVVLGGFTFGALTPWPASADSSMPQDKAGLDQAIHDYLMSHPDVVLQALKAGQQQADAEAAEQSRRTIITKQEELIEAPDDLVQGNPKGDVTVVEFFDYRCPYCKQVEPSLDALLKEDGKLRIVYKEFPILGEASTYATRVALAAKQQGKYAEFHRAMMATKGEIGDDAVLAVAAALGLDMTKLKADMAAPEIDKLIDRNYTLADALDIQGTPALIIGDTLIPGATDLDALRKDIAAVRKGG